MCLCALHKLLKKYTIYFSSLYSICYTILSVVVVVGGVFFSKENYIFIQQGCITLIISGSKEMYCATNTF